MKNEKCYKRLILQTI